MASISRRGLKVSDQNVKLTTTATTTITSQKSVPAILSRKRKSDHLDMDYPWLSSDLNIFQISNSLRDQEQDEEEPMMVCLENLPPSEQPSRKKQCFSTSSSVRVPLGTLSSNTSRLAQQGSQLKSKLVTSISAPKQASQNEQPDKNSSQRKTRLCQSWSQFREFAQISAKSSRLRGDAPMPEVRWADKQEIWNLMCKKERGMYLRQTGEELLARHPCLQPRMRAILFDWLVEVCEVYKLHRETFYLAADFIDRYLGSSTNVPKTRVQLIGVTCLFIASKIEEIYPPKLQEFAYVTDGACSEDEILNMELVILKALNWGLSPMTPNSWVKLYLQIDQTSDYVERNGSNPPENEDLVLPQYADKEFCKVMSLLDLCILDMGSLAFPYSVLAASALYHCQDQATALGSSGYIWDEISPCVNWMSPFVFALRELSPKTILPTKPMSGVSQDDLANIQVHSVELAVLDRAQQRQAMLLEEVNRQSPEPMQHQAMYSSVEMTPPVESDCIYTPQKSVQHSRKSQMSPLSSSVFMTPTTDSQFW